MKEWQTNLIGAIVIIIIGIGLLFGATGINIPSAYRTFLGIPYDVNPAYGFAFYEMLVLLMLGFLIMGMGLGILANTYPIYRLERKLASQTIPPPPFHAPPPKEE
jgi:hypothetical protein